MSTRPSSHERAISARKNGLFDGEIVPVPDPAAQGRSPCSSLKDEGVRTGTTVEGAGQTQARRSAPTAPSPPATAQPNLGRRRSSSRHESRPGRNSSAHRSWRRSARTAPWPDPIRRCLSQPSNAIRKALQRENPHIPTTSICIEINEAFAVVAIQSMRDLGVGSANVNVNGGAIAIGHPAGATGTRIALHLILELARRGGGIGAAGLCGGGGQGEALIFRVSA